MARSSLGRCGHTERPSVWVWLPVTVDHLLSSLLQISVLSAQYSVRSAKSTQTDKIMDTVGKTLQWSSHLRSRAVIYVSEDEVRRLPSRPPSCLPSPPSASSSGCSRGVWVSPRSWASRILRNQVSCYHRHQTTDICQQQSQSSLYNHSPVGLIHVLVTVQSIVWKSFQLENIIPSWGFVSGVYYIITILFLSWNHETQLSRDKELRPLTGLELQ